MDGANKLYGIKIMKKTISRLSTILLLIIFIILNLNENVFNSQGPGGPVRSKKQEKILKEFIKEFNKTEISVDDFLQTALICGPAIYNYFLTDKSLEKVGIPTTIHVPIHGTDKFQTLKSRTYMNKDIGKLFKSKIVRKFFKQLSNGKARPANQSERDTYYILISYEIENKPVSIIEKDDIRVLFDFVDDKIFFIDYISDYSREKQEKNEDKFKPTDLKQLILLTDQETVGNNITVEILADYVKQLEKFMKSYSKNLKGSYKNLAITITLHKKKNCDIKIYSEPKLSKSAIKNLTKKLNKIKYPRPKKESISFQAVFQVNYK